MKKIAVTVLAASALLLAVSAQAQVSFGPRVGLNISNLNYVYKSGNVPTSKVQFGAQVGVTMNAQFGNLSLQPSLLYTMKGDQVESKDSQSFNSGGQTYSYSAENTSSRRFNYIELPINLVYNTKGEAGGFQAFAGPYIALGVGGTVKSDRKSTETVNGVTTTKSESRSIDVAFVSQEGKDDKAYVRSLDAGFNFGLGYKSGPIQAQLGYALGLGNLVAKDQNGKDPEITVNNRGFQLSLAYFFTK